MNLKIRNLREDKDLTQCNIAKLLNCSQQTYSRYETGEISIDVESLITLSKFYDTSVDFLIGLTDIKKPYKRI